jgi:hypothetical protein
MPLGVMTRYTACWQSYRFYSTADRCQIRLCVSFRFVSFLIKSHCFAFFCYSQPTDAETDTSSSISTGTESATGISSNNSIQACQCHHDTRESVNGPVDSDVFLCVSLVTSVSAEDMDMEFVGVDRLMVLQEETGLQLQVI